MRRRFVLLAATAAALTIHPGGHAFAAARTSGPVLDHGTGGSGRE